MKKFIVVALFVFFISPLALADQWCEWSGTQGINCQSDGRGFILIENRPTRTPSVANAAGWYKVIVTEPSVGVDETKDAEVWDKVGNQITLTWTVRDLTATEIDEQIASPMQIEMYYVWKALLATGTITQQQAADNLPQEMVDAYMARKRLLGD